MPKASSKTLITEEKSVSEEEVIEIEDDPPEDTGGHGVINPIEAWHHVQLLDEAMQALEAKVNTGEIKNILRDTLDEVYQAIINIIPSMREASTADVLKSIKDPTCLVLHKGLERAEQLLKDITSEEDAPSRRSVIEGAQEVGNLTDEHRELIIELFELMEVAYDHEAKVCSCLKRLSRTLNAQQLQVIVQSSIKPLITLKALIFISSSSSSSFILQTSTSYWHSDNKTGFKKLLLLATTQLPFPSFPH